VLLEVDELEDVVVCIAATPHTTALIVALLSLIISKLIFVSIIDLIVDLGSLITSTLPESVLISSIFAALSDANSIPGVQ